MSQPTPYTPTTDFSQQESINASGRSTVSTSALDAELANIGTTIGQTLANLTLLQRDDGRLKDVSVELHTISQEVLNLMGGFNLRGLWSEFTYYAKNDLCSNGAYTYLCRIAHTSGGSFDAENWVQFGFTSGADAAQAAAAAQTSASEAAGSAATAAGSATASAGSAATSTAQAVAAGTSAATATAKAGSASTSATNAALSAAAAAASAASAAVFTQLGAGAVSRTYQEKMRESASLYDFGAKGDGVTDDTAAIAAAIASSLPLFAPAGTYLLRLSKSLAMEGGATVCAMIAKSGMILRGAGHDLVTFKLMDNESTDASPKYWNLIGGNTAIDGLHISGITFDLNGQNNKISPNRAGLVWNNFNCAALMISGSVATVGVDARLTNSSVTHCRVKNSPGVTCIGLGQSNSAGYVLGDNIEIAHNVFENNGLDCNDHSSVYAWANNVHMHHNKFTHPTMSSGVQSPLACAELHGSGNYFHDNEVENYLWGCYVAGNFTSVARGQYVFNNTYKVAQKAIVAFNETVAEPGMADIHVYDNTVILTNDYQHTDGSAKRAFDFTPSQGRIDGLSVHDNDLTTTDTYGAVAIKVGVLAVGRSVKNVNVHDNKTKGFGTPIVVGTVGGGFVDAAKVHDNQNLDITPNTTAPTITIGVYVTGSNGDVEVYANQHTGSIAAHPAYGLYMDGTFSSLRADGNTAPASSSAAVLDLSTVAGKRSGDQALTFAALPAQSTWKIGDVAHNSGSAELGSASSKYVIDGWRRLTNGTGNVLNTDWVQRRSLTGN